MAYADDLCFLIGCDSVAVSEERANKALRKAYEWSQQHSLAFCPVKLEYMIFQRVHKEEEPVILLNNIPLERRMHVTYLGLIITPNLSWTTHIKEKLVKAKKALTVSNNAFGKMWGPSPKMMCWTYKAIALPKLLYASHVWHKETYRKNVQKLLLPLTRLALLNLAPCRIKTPTAGLQMALGSIPIHLIARERMCKQYSVSTPMSLIQSRVTRVTNSRYTRTINSKDSHPSRLTTFKRSRHPTHIRNWSSIV